MQKDTLLLRLPADLKAQLVQRAAAADISSNSLVVRAIEAYLGVPDHEDIREALTECYAQIAKLHARVKTLESQQMTPKWLQPLEERLGALEERQQSSLIPTELPSPPPPAPESEHSAESLGAEKAVRAEMPADSEAEADDEAQLPSEQPDMVAEPTAEEPTIKEAPNANEVAETAESSSEETKSSSEDAPFLNKLIACSTPEVEEGSVLTIQIYTGELLENLQVRKVVGGLALVRDEEGFIYYQRFRARQEGDEELDDSLDELRLQGVELDFEHLMERPPRIRRRRRKSPS